jgi:peptidyl-dipeptidase A
MMKKAIALILALWVAECWSMGYKPKHVAADSAWLVEIQHRMEKVDTMFAAATWEYYQGGYYAGDLERASKEYQILVYTKYNIDRLKRIQGLFKDPVLDRAARLAYIKYLTDWCYYGTDIGDAQMSLIKTFIEFRAHFEGQDRTDIYLRRILHGDPGRERREMAWHARISICEKIAKNLKMLVQDRNRMARYRDFDNFVEFQLNSIGLTQDGLLKLLDGLNLASRDKYLEIYMHKKNRLNLDKLQIWDILYQPDLLEFDSAFKKNEVVPTMYNAFGALGFNLDKTNILLEIEPRSYKLQSGLCMAIQVPNDMRISAQIVDGFSSYRVLFHEYGHALHNSFINRDHYIMRVRTDGVICESMASICEELLYRPHWLNKYMKFSEKEISVLVPKLKESRIIELRIALAYTYFEMELYRTNAENPDKLFWDIMERVLFCGRQDGSEAWASVHHFTDSPVYYQNYILGDLIAAQTMQHIRKLNGSIIDNPATAEYLINRCYKYGALYNWFDLVELATGEKLDTKYYLEDILNYDNDIEIEEVNTAKGGQ